MEGITRQIAAFAQIPQYNTYTAIWRRVTIFDEPLSKPKGKNISASTDGSGVKMNMSGEYFEEKYGDGKKKFLKVTIPKSLTLCLQLNKVISLLEKPSSLQI